jgi:hypothetical protein
MICFRFQDYVFVAIATPKSLLLAYRPWQIELPEPEVQSCCSLNQKKKLHSEAAIQISKSN